MPIGSKILNASVHVTGARQCLAMVITGDEALWLSCVVVVPPAVGDRLVDEDVLVEPQRLPLRDAHAVASRADHAHRAVLRHRLIEGVEHVGRGLVLAHLGGEVEHAGAKQMLDFRRLVLRRDDWLGLSLHAAPSSVTAVARSVGVRA
jgi:hypothetical protein